MDVICHRACPVGAPENSIAAARAVPERVDMIEIDVQRCASGELVVFHDQLLDRMTGASGAVAGTDWERLQELTLADSDATIHRLSAFVAAVPDSMGLNIELKHAGIADSLRRALDGVENDLLLSSFVPQAIAPFAEDPIDTALLLDAETASDWESALAGAQSLDAAAVHPPEEAIDAARIASAHEHDLAVNAWTVLESTRVNELRKAGIDGVIVDDWRILPEALVGFDE